MLPRRFAWGNIQPASSLVYCTRLLHLLRTRYCWCWSQYPALCCYGDCVMHISTVLVRTSQDPWPKSPVRGTSVLNEVITVLCYHHHLGRPCVTLDFQLRHVVKYTSCARQLIDARLPNSGEISQGNYLEVVVYFIEVVKRFYSIFNRLLGLWGLDKLPQVFTPDCWLVEQCAKPKRVPGQLSSIGSMSRDRGIKL